jgi:hypothetical protein
MSVPHFSKRENCEKIELMDCKRPIDQTRNNNAGTADGTFQRHFLDGIHSPFEEASERRSSIKK